MEKTNEAIIVEQALDTIYTMEDFENLIDALMY